MVGKRPASIIEAKKQVVDMGVKLKSSGLVAGTWGNISVRVDDNTMVITPSGKNYEQSNPEDMVVVNINTLEHQGDLKPSTEVKFHAAIYKNRKEINGVIHNHAMNASTVAAARREVPAVLDDQAQIIGTTIRCADYALPGTEKITKNVVSALSGRMGALLANHGAVTIGRDLEEAYTASIVLEKACKAFVEGEFLGQAKTLSKFDAVLMHQIYLKKYAKK